MFRRSPWDREPPFDINSLLNTRHRQRPTHPHVPSYPPFPDHHDMPYPCDPLLRYARKYRHTHFDATDTLSSTDLSPSDWEEPHTPSPSYPKPRRHHHHYNHRSPSAPPHPTTHPSLRTLPITLPTPTARTLHANEVLLLPPLTHLHITIHIRTRSHDWDLDPIRAAIPSPTPFSAGVAQILDLYLPDARALHDHGHGHGHGRDHSYIRALVKQRGRWEEPRGGTKMGELSRGAEMVGGGVEVRIEVGGGEGG